MAARIRWTAGMDALLGSMSDCDVADELGIHQRTARLRRLKLNIPAFGNNVGFTWTSEMDALLGVLLDWEVSEKLGVSRGVVQMRRTALGISSSWIAVWTPEKDALLGTMIDKEVAAQLGIGIGPATRRRGELGIPSWAEQNRILPEWLCKYDPEAQRFYSERRRHRKASVLDTLTFGQWDFACEWFDNKCAYCGREAFLTEDHLVPLSKGGPRTVLNIIPACLSCNQSKCAKRAHLWIYWKFGMLEGKEIVDRVIRYLTEARERWPV